MVPAVHQADAVGAYQRRTIAAASVNNAPLQFSTGFRFFAEARRNDDECLYLLFLRQVFHVVGTILCGHHQDGQVGGGHLFHVVKHFDALHLVFLGVHHAQRALVAALKNVSHHGAARLVNVVGAAYYYNAFRM